ncbi:glucose dehydrogenase [FAD, quinone]-like [Odontomachus brunneus]|uniref:glucose dehydrogenase [FAD, quinone]-like n=1 Tax=Odontomachus brunneus TaxID=486640 RepID=UPI0013F184E8|nr:glucose dehydrogenase [FAD, quinone]-like [Odontomachus brunneus]
MDVFNPIPVPCQDPFLGGLSIADACPASPITYLLATLNMMAAYSPAINDPCNHIKLTLRPSGTYDFIVVGAGAAGPIVAARLSEITKWSVLLLEAGPDEAPGMQIPSNLGLYLNTNMDWKYKTNNEKNACLETGGRCSWPRGKNLGGCTSHHGMAYHRGHQKDYTRWVKMGATGWSWQEVLPYFKKSENNKDIGRFVSKEHHGFGGPLIVERFPWQPPFAMDVLVAADEVKLGTTNDMVGEKITGFTIAQTISNKGVRLSSSRAYLWPARNRKNLHVTVNATVTRIITKADGKNRKASGVEFIINGKRHKATARKEVILTAGAINSPQLLLLSGIGPKAHLNEMKIQTVVELPGVGKNLHNHASYGMDFVLNQPAVEELNSINIYSYMYNQTGPLASTGLAQLTAILKSSYTTDDDPDIQIFFAGYQAICDMEGKIPDLQTRSNQTIRMTSVNLQTRSRGWIMLDSKDPMKPPNIWSNELSKPRDRDIIYQGIKKILDLSKASTLNKYGLKLIVNTAEKCKKFGKPVASNKDYWDCQIRQKTRPENHQAGTCKMGATNDDLAVVDPKLKVRYMTGLRVADASVMPQVVSGNPVATIHMIAERVADFIKEEYGVLGMLER